MPEHHRQTTKPSVTQAFNVHVRHFMSYIVLQRHYHVLCLTTSIHPLPNRVRSSASSFIVFCRLVSLRSSSSCWCLLLCLPFSSIFCSVTRFRVQFIRRLWPSSFFLLFYDIPFLIYFKYHFLIFTPSIKQIFSIFLRYHSVIFF
jgi:hypothetical protein